MDITLLLPWPPSVNTYWRHVIVKTKRGYVQRTLLSVKGRKYRTQAVFAVRKQSPSVLACQFSGRVRITLDLYPPDRRRRDIDNYPKGVLDALTYAKVWEDDSQVDEMLVRRCDVDKQGYVALHIQSIEQDESRALYLVK